MKYNGTLDIATGLGATSKNWKNQKMEWSDFAAKLQKEHKTPETIKEYLAASKQEQSKIKDIGGYVGGYLRSGRRKPENVMHRQVLTLDIDFAHNDFWDDFKMQFDNAAVLHATHKHTEASPRYRLVIPVSREMTPDEYVAISRSVAGTLNIELFDNTTFETNRLMFWPSSSSDVSYYSELQDGEWLDADAVLSSYVDWTDTSAWPTADRKLQEVKLASQKQEDPEIKRGIVGAFCRSYTISEAISAFLPDIYIPAADERYTYVKGTASAGLTLYDDKFAYSHHGTDPCGGKLCNAFDLVRIHLFGHLDVDNRKEGAKPKSFAAMEDYSRLDNNVKKTIATETFDKAKYDFVTEQGVDAPEVLGEQDKEWVTELELDGKGKYMSTAGNISLVFMHDAYLKNKFKQNLFDGKFYVFGSLPWRSILEPEPLKNVDYSGLRNYIESVYGIASTLKIEDALNLEFEKNSFHPIVDYLGALKWDGKPRVDKLLVDYFGADDNVYSYEAIRKPLVAAVARVYHPGTKFDLVLTLVSDQGTGKSTFFKKLGLGWFSDTFMTVHGKEALEQIQGAWLIEMAELSGLRKADVEAVKHFISKQEDMYRPAYGRTVETYKRQCIFFGSTNNKDFLRDPTGNRRFMPVDVTPHRSTKSIFNTELEESVDQIWAEAVEMFRNHEKLFLSPEAEKIATKEQQNHSEHDERTGIIQAYLDTPLPTDWNDLDQFERKLFIEDPLSPAGTLDRDYVCVAEIWCECLGKDKKDMNRYNTREVNDILKSLRDWQGVNSTRNFKLYGKQKYYARKLD
jgi:predicted P-loop ATPase